jgi:hypothetical protein
MIDDRFHSSDIGSGRQYQFDRHLDLAARAYHFREEPLCHGGTSQKHLAFLVNQNMRSTKARFKTLRRAQIAAAQEYIGQIIVNDVFGAAAIRNLKAFMLRRTDGARMRFPSLARLLRSDPLLS